jgi:hypothetical protein
VLCGKPLSWRGLGLFEILDVEFAPTVICLGVREITLIRPRVSQAYISRTKIGFTIQIISDIFEADVSFDNYLGVRFPVIRIPVHV